MGGKDAAVAVQQGQRSILRLPGPRAACHLTMRLDQMGHGSRDAAMAVGEQPAMGVERQLAVMIEVAVPGAGPCLAAPAQADLFQKDRQRDGEAVVDRGVADIPKLDPSGRPCALDEGRQAALKALILRGPKLERDGCVAWRTRDLCRLVEDRFGVRYGETGMLRLVKSLDLSRQKARPVHPEADPGAQERFKKSSPP